MLDVYLYGEHVGSVTQDASGLSFAYNDRALDQPDRYSLSVRLPVQRAPYPHHVSAPFFDNLLPEGDARDLLAETAKYDPSDVQGLLGAIGGECAGAVSLWPAGEKPAATPTYMSCTAADMERLFSDTNGSAFAEAHITGRQSMSGAQNKLVLLRQGTSYALPRRGAPTNVILKRERQRYPGLVQNELASLHLMQLAGVPVVEATAPIGLPGLFESKRYDRVDKGGALIRLHQEDFCQATGKLPRQKYQQHGGPALADITAVLVRYSTQPFVDIEYLARWTIANICIGNNDAHAKNLSLLYGPSGMHLAPVYDVVCTSAYPAIDQKFSLAFGGSYTLEGITATAFRKCARSLQMTSAHLNRCVEEVTTQLASHVDQVCHDVAITYGETPALDVLNSGVKTQSATLRERLID